MTSTDTNYHALYDFSLINNGVSQFLNDTKTHPILKYKMFILLFMLVFVGSFILFMIHSVVSDKPITGHIYWRHLFETPNMNDDNYGVVNDSSRDYSSRISSAVIFRKAIEGFDAKNKPDDKSKDNGLKDNGAKSSADVEGAKKDKETKKPTPCSTDCGQYIALQAKINTLGKMVDEVKEQKDKIKQVADSIQSVGVKIENLSKSLAPGGKFKPQF